ncbi:H/ACA RNA-protein complex component Cbf5p [candidate division MSBL1 archaeon SCGC-AAA382A20]|uniref:Probable tRNA pseudouridine synthase B n=1 Tax=candidate division MSBL1 archaeon SCGC-AAA382A20 TaxID=1698280 RepID=A0A133VHA5_9EURY|nr:H/ACA RNA-protein complex component Cbf5p [candidate division MSBL1 archaeon SCGC-AAA382A20]
MNGVVILNELPADEKREVLIKANDFTNPEYGCDPESRAVEDLLELGVINLDKPPGPTSHEVVSWIKRILHVKKAGHGGTLDPRVTGILPVALQRATKLTQALLPAGKEYVTVMHIHKNVGSEKLEKTLESFRGEITQKPPVRASVKRKPRKREIYYLEILERESRDVLIRVGCEAGTYIRKLCHDIGESLGTGAHMAELRRTRTGPFEEGENLSNLHDLADAFVFWREDGLEEPLREVVLPAEKIVEHLPKIVVRDGAVDALCRGASLAAPGVLSVETGIDSGAMVAEMTLKGELIALANAEMGSEEIVNAEHGIVAEPERVVMEPGTYPKNWN